MLAHIRESLEEGKSIKSFLPWLKDQYEELYQSQLPLHIERWNKLLAIHEVKHLFTKWSTERTWAQSYIALKDFIDQYNRIPEKKDSDKKLYIWTHRMIRYLKNNTSFAKNPSVHAARKKNLLSLSLIQQQLDVLSPKERWDYHFGNLKQFVEMNHRLPKESRYVSTEEYKLAHWLAVQIQVLRGRSRWEMSEERREQILSIPLVLQRYVSMKKLRD
jgi:hypothetical protein